MAWVGKYDHHHDVGEVVHLKGLGCPLTSKYVLAQSCQDALKSEEVLKGDDAVDSPLQVMQDDGRKGVGEGWDQGHEPEDADTLVGVAEEEVRLNDQYHSHEAEHRQCQMALVDGLLSRVRFTLCM